MQKDTVHSILIVKTSAIGDVVQTFPALEYLRKKYPEARIDWVVEEGIAPLLRSHPFLSSVMTINTRGWRKKPFSKETFGEVRAFLRLLRSRTYDVLFDLQGNTKSAFVTGSARAKEKIGFGWKSVRERSNLLVTDKKREVPYGLNIRSKYLSLVKEGDELFESQGVVLNISEEEQKRKEQILSDPKLQRSLLIMVAFGSKWINKQLEEKTLSDFLELISQRYHPSFLLIYGNAEEESMARRLHHRFQENSIAVGSLSLSLWQSLMGEVDEVIAVDSAALHLCGTTLTPSFSVFGPSRASIYKPLEKRHVSLEGACPYGMNFEKHCPRLRTCKTGACIRTLTAEALFNAFSFSKQGIE
jgi:heptosyltransferase-1